MDLRISELLVDFELEERQRAGTRLESVAARERSLAPVNPDPCGGCAN